MDIRALRSMTIVGNTYEDYKRNLDFAMKGYILVQIIGLHKDEEGCYSSLVFYYDNKKQDDKEEHVLCNRCEDIELLKYWVDKPVYVKGYCWNKEFDGWTVLYIDEKEERDWLGHLNLYFDYKGNKYPVYGFLPSRLTMSTDSTYYNAIYSYKV